MDPPVDQDLADCQLSASPEDSIITNLPDRDIIRCRSFLFQAPGCLQLSDQVLSLVGFQQPALRLLREVWCEHYGNHAEEDCHQAFDDENLHFIRMSANEEFGLLLTHRHPS